MFMSVPQNKIQNAHYISHPSGKGCEGVVIIRESNIRHFKQKKLLRVFPSTINTVGIILNEELNIS